MSASRWNNDGGQRLVIAYPTPSALARGEQRKTARGAVLLGTLAGAGRTKAGRTKERTKGISPNTALAENKGDKSQYRSSEAWSRTTCSTTSSWGRAGKGGTATSASCSCCPAPHANAHLPRQRYLPDPTCKKAEIGSVFTKIIASPCGVTRCEGAGRARMGPADANLQNHMVQSVHLCSRCTSAANLRRGGSFSIWCVGRCAATSRDRQDC